MILEATLDLVYRMLLRFENTARPGQSISTWIENPGQISHLFAPPL